MNRREALIDIVALAGAICAGYYGGGSIQSGKTGELPGPEEYKVRSGVFIRGEEKIITDGDHLLKAEVNEHVFQAALRLLGETWGDSDALNEFLKVYPLRFAINVEGLETLARYRGTRETSEPEILFSTEFIIMYYKRQSPNWGPPERVIFHEFRHLFQDATSLLPNSREISTSMFSGCTALGTLTGIRRARRNIGENPVPTDDDTQLVQLIENGFWGTAIGLGGGLAAATQFRPKEIDADIFSTAVMVTRGVTNLGGSFFSYLNE